MCSKRDRAVTWVFCGDLHLSFMFSGILQKDLFKGGEDIIVMLVTQSLLSSFL